MTEQINSGIELMLVGMGIVFAFLTMLVVMIKLMSRLVQRYFPEAPVASKVRLESNQDSGVVAAITAAVHHYRDTHKS